MEFSFNLWWFWAGVMFLAALIFELPDMTEKERKWGARIANVGMFICFAMHWGNKWGWW